MSKVDFLRPLTALFVTVGIATVIGCDKQTLTDYLDNQFAIVNYRNL